jgi:DNA-binding NtrC family response regulator
MTPRIFQIAHDGDLMRLREMVLVQSGYSVTSAAGNAEVRRLLTQEAPFDAFFIGWSMTLDERKDIIVWLKQHWPSVPVVAIHNAFQSATAGADFCASHDTPEEWIGAVKAATRKIWDAGISA